MAPHLHRPPYTSPYLPWPPCSPAGEDDIEAESTDDDDEAAGAHDGAERARRESKGGSKGRTSRRGSMLAADGAAAAPSRAASRRGSARRMSQVDLAAAFPQALATAPRSEAPPSPTKLEVAAFDAPSADSYVRLDITSTVNEAEAGAWPCVAPELASTWPLSTPLRPSPTLSTLLRPSPPLRDTVSLGHALPISPDLPNLHQISPRPPPRPPLDLHSISARPQPMPSRLPLSRPPSRSRRSCPRRRRRSPLSS